MGLTIDLSGRTVLVVGGGGGGIGTSACIQAARAGADIVSFTDMAEHLAATVEAVEALGQRASGAVVDVRDTDALAAAVDAAGAAEGRIDGLVNVVGGSKFPDWHRTVDYTVESFDNIMATNVRYVMVTAQRVAAGLIAAGRPGSIVSISSIASRSAPLISAYGAAKAALDSLSRTMSVEWGRHGIRVNTVAAGTIATPRAGQSDLADVAGKYIPLGRRGTPDDIAIAATFLLSDLAGYVTGHTLVVDGGSNLQGAGTDESFLPAFVTSPAIRSRFE